MVINDTHRGRTMHRSPALLVSLAFPTLVLAHGDGGTGAAERVLHILGSAEHLWTVMLLMLAGMFVRRIILRLHAHLSRMLQQDRTSRDS